MATRRSPGVVRDAITKYLDGIEDDASIDEIYDAVSIALGGEVARSSVRSYLNLNTPSIHPYGPWSLSPGPSMTDNYIYGQATLLLDDCLSWLPGRADRSIHAVVTDPPYGFVEYSSEQKAKLRSGRGGVWRSLPLRWPSALSVAVYRADHPEDLEVVLDVLFTAGRRR